MAAKKTALTNTVQLPAGVSATYANDTLTVKGPKGEVARKLFDPMLTIKADASTVTISSAKDSKRERRVANTFEAHVKNMIRGVQTPYKNVLKVCSGHFPMNVSIAGEVLSVKNFLGEKSPRTLKLKKGVAVKVEGDKLTVEGCDKDLVGAVSSDIELLTSKRNRDLRVFQDGIYLIEQSGEKVGES